MQKYGAGFNVYRKYFIKAYTTHALTMAVTTYDNIENGG